ncbi:MAG TPA: LLM class flavin-dependent oxidoreductase [Chloroflexota bacterium]
MRALPLFHPVQVATEAVVCDHLSGGRYIAGFGAGGDERNDIAANLNIGQASERHERMLEEIDVILRCWTEQEAFDYDGRYYQLKNIKINPLPLQQPHPPVALACSRSDSTLQYAATHGLSPLISFFDPPSGLADMGQIFMDAGKEAGVETRRSSIRMPRFVHVAETTKKAWAEVQEWEPHMQRRKMIFPWQFRRLVPAGGSVDDVTLEVMADSGSIFIGDPETVYQGIKTMYGDVGGFGVLLLMSGWRDSGTRAQRYRGLRLFMEHVAPRLAKLDPDAPASSPDGAGRVPAALNR